MPHPLQTPATPPPLPNQLISDYKTPPGKSLPRDLMASVNAAVDFLVRTRPLGVSMGNAIKFLKLCISKTDPNGERRGALGVGRRGRGQGRPAGAAGGLYPGKGGPAANSPPIPADLCSTPPTVPPPNA